MTELNMSSLGFSPKSLLSFLPYKAYLSLFNFFKITIKVVYSYQKTALPDTKA